ncbi:MAG TPA: hypothetical protein PKM67_03160 [Kiritimatiellia bacterium]|nr:hypothetical protein [Kiritimatiellia bacterium]HNS80438.1 hypothetical protein [Kiritimatiellia bacterium]
MKKIIIVCDSVADAPLEELDGRTPLQTARCPFASRLAQTGQTGLLTLPRAGTEDHGEQLLGLFAGMTREQASALRQGPLEAMASGIDLSDYDFAWCGHFVTMDGDVLRDSLVRSLSLEETRWLAEQLQREWDAQRVRFAATEPSRLLVLYSTAGGARPQPGHPPHLSEGARADEFIRRSRADNIVRDIFERSRRILDSQPLNEIRVDLGENPANALWLWGGGPMSGMHELFTGFRISGAMLTQCPMAAGLARLAGMETIEMRDVWTAGGGMAFNLPLLVQELRQKDLLLVYAGAPRPGGRYGSAVEKVRAIEAMDANLLGPLSDVLAAHRPCRIILAANRGVSTPTGLPEAGRIPFVLAGDGIGADETQNWNEEEAARGALGSVKLSRLADLLE